MAYDHKQRHGGLQRLLCRLSVQDQKTFGAEMIRVANRIIELQDFFISAHNRGRLVDQKAWDEFNEAKQIYKAALERFKDAYENDHSS